MRLKAIVEGNRIIFPRFTKINKRQVEVEVELPDENVQVYSDEELDKMAVSELSHLIWDNVEVDEKDINRDYRELLIEALMEKYGK